MVLVYIFIYISFTQIQKFKQGDEVVVKSDEHLVKELQKEHAGWDESMISVSLIFFRLVLMFIYFMVFSLVNIVGFHLEVNANSCGHVLKEARRVNDIRLNSRANYTCTSRNY